MVAHTGLSLYRYVLKYRINRAIDLLQTTDMPAFEIAERVGFKDYNHFLKYFKNNRLHHPQLSDLTENPQNHLCVFAAGFDLFKNKFR